MRLTDTGKKKADKYIAPLPIRPYFPLILGASLLFWCGCAACYEACRICIEDLYGQFGILLIILILVAAVFCAATRLLAPSMLILALLVGGFIGVSHAVQVVGATASIQQGDADGALCVLAQDPRNGAYGFTCMADVTLANGNRMKAQLRLKDANGLLCGKCIRIIHGSISIDEKRSDFLWNNGAHAMLKVNEFDVIEPDGVSGILIRARERAVASFEDCGDAGVLLQALVCGWRLRLSDSELYRSFKVCGLAHLVAVSGAHLVIVTGMLAALLKALRCPRKAFIFILIAAMSGYFIIAGEPVSALRACIMTSLGLFSFFGSRRPSTPNAIGLAIFALIAQSPESAVSASFALSCLSTLGIVLLAPLFSYWLSRTPLSHVSFIADALSLSLAAMIASQPLSCALFSQLSLISPLANALAGPLFPLMCTIGFASGIASVFFPAAQIALNAASVFCTDCFIRLVGAISAIPYACIPMCIDIPSALAISGGLIAFLYVGWTSVNRATIALLTGSFALILVMIFFICPITRQDRIVMLDVGQGDAYLIESHGATLLIDTGNQDGKLLAALARQGVAHLDAVVITHSDDDHCGSLDALATSVAVDEVYLADGMFSVGNEKSIDLVAQAAKASTDVLALSFQDKLRIGDFEARMIWPKRFTDDGGNADSICLIIDCDADEDGLSDMRALFTGDAEREQLGSILEDDLVEHVDLLKVGHHGSKASMDAKQVEALSPQIALIGVGADNRYGHPSPEIVSMLENIGCKVFRSDVDGDVSCIIGSDGVSVATQH